MRLLRGTATRARRVSRRQRRRAGDGSSGASQRAGRADRQPPAGQDAAPIAPRRGRRGERPVAVACDEGRRSPSCVRLRGRLDCADAAPQREALGPVRSHRRGGRRDRGRQPASGESIPRRADDRGPQRRQRGHAGSTRAARRAGPPRARGHADTAFRRAAGGSAVATAARVESRPLRAVPVPRGGRPAGRRARASALALRRSRALAWSGRACLALGGDRRGDRRVGVESRRALGRAGLDEALRLRRTREADRLHTLLARIWSATARRT